MINMKPFFLSITLFLITISAAFSQESEGFLTRAIIVDGDTVPIYIMNEIRVFAPIIYKNKHDAIKFTKLIKNVKKVYPYAKITGIKVKEYEEIAKNAKNERERKAKMKMAEDELREQFEDDIKSLEYSQGILLIKLIDRETGNSSFELIKEFRGKIMAGIYQAIGKLFGYNLKLNYDPTGDDKEVEKIVLMIESGAI